MGMNVALTGAEGYIGSRMGHVLLEAGHEVTGFDSGLHRVARLYHSRDRRPAMVDIDVRDMTAEQVVEQTRKDLAYWRSLWDAA